MTRLKERNVEASLRTLDRLKRQKIADGTNFMVGIEIVALVYLPKTMNKKKQKEYDKQMMCVPKHFIWGLPEKKNYGH